MAEAGFHGFECKRGDDPADDGIEHSHLPVRHRAIQEPESDRSQDQRPQFQDCDNQVRRLFAETHRLRNQPGSQ